MADKKKKGKVSGAIKAVGADIKDIGTTFAKGDWKTRVSFLIMGFGQLTRKQWVRGIAFFGFGGSFYPIYGVLRGRIS